jgi:nitroreductase
MDLSTPEHLEIVDHLLTTTRSVRKRLDLTRPVEAAVIEECLNIAVQAPTGSNQQGWRFVVITDAEVKAQIAYYYREVGRGYFAQRKQSSSESVPGKPDPQQMQRVLTSAEYLTEHLHEVPVLIIPCIEGRVDGKPSNQQAGFWGSILPAAWSLMLALRARGLGSAWTTFHLTYEKEVAQLLGIPENVTQAALLPVAYFLGEDFSPASRLPIHERTYWNHWGSQR